MKNKVLTLIYSILLSLSIVISNNVEYSGYIDDSYKNNYIKSFDIKSLLIFLVLTIIIYFVLHSILKKLEKINLKISTSDNSIFLKVFLPILIVFFICFTVFFPGIKTIDSEMILMYKNTISNQHPLMYIKFFSLFFTIFKNYTLASSIYSLIQMTIVAISISYVINWLYKKGIKKSILVIIICYYILFPVFAIYSITFTKDVLFSTFILLLIPITYDIISKKEISIKQFIYFCILSILSIVFKNNGYIVIILFMLVIILSINKKNDFIIYCFIILIISFVPKSFSNEQLFKETVDIPIQQISAVIANDGNITPKEEKFINQIIITSLIKNKFSPLTSDSIKWDSSFNDSYLNRHKKEFINTWFNLFRKNKLIYIKQYMLQTYFFWRPSILENVYIDNLNNKTIYNAIYFNSYFFSHGFILWSTLFLILLAIKKEKYIVFKLIIPLIGLYFSIFIGTPISTQFRYILPIVICLPILYTLCFLEKKY